jgi:hypothetical protein
MGCFDVQVFYQAAIDDGDAHASGDRLLVRSDDFSRLRHLVGIRRDRTIGWRDLLWVDQGLAVEAERAALGAGGGKAGIVGEVEIHAVE